MSRAGSLLGLLWLLTGSGHSVFAAANSAEAAKSSFDVWPVEAGWQEVTVPAMVQTRDGYLWLGTYHGLVRFDGVRFVVFNASNTPGLRNGIITSLYEDAQGVLWIGHETGDLTRLAGGEFEPVDLGSAWPGGSIETITSDENGDLWLINDSGFLFRVRDGQLAEAPGGASPSRKPALTRAKDGKLWLVSNGLVATIEGGRVVPFQFGGTNQADFFERVLPARGGGLWVLGNERIRRWRNGRWGEALAGCPPGPGAVTCLLETRSGVVLAGTIKDGLYLLTTEAPPAHFSRTNGLSHDWVRSLCEDHEGNIWVGTGSSFDGLRPRKVKMLNAPDGWEGCVVLSFTVNPDGSAWIGTEGAGLYHYQNPGWARFSESNGLSNLFVWSVLETRQGDLFAGTWGAGLLARHGERFESQGGLSQITAPVVCLYQGQGGELWIGTTTGLHRYERGKLVWFAGKDKLFRPDIRAVTESPDGTLWFGMSGGGLGALKDGALQQFRRRDGVNSDFVVSLYAEADGTLWIGTSDNGLGRWKQGRFAVISTQQGLPSSIVTHIVDDGGGNLWLGSQQGILRVSKMELNGCADGTRSSIHCLSYGKSEGLASQTCSGGFQPGACKAADGRLWFPTAKGLAIVDPADVSINTAPPPVVIEELLADGQSQSLKPEREPPPAPGEAGSTGLPAPGASMARAPFAPLEIPAGKQRFELRYTGLSFAAPDKVRFRYKLEGLETDWQEAGGKRVAQYSYLRPGTYTFRVTACNNDEMWNQEGAAVTFTVLPHFWQTWWFELLSIATGAGAVGAGVLWVTRRRVRRRLEHLERQRALERERARIARDIHDDLGASLTRITMLSQSVRGELATEHQAAADVDQIFNTARELTRAMDEIVWAVNPRHDTLDSLVTYLGRFAQQFLSVAGIRCRLDVPLHLPAWALTAEVRHSVFLALKEALHNVVKHAQASEVRISLELLPDGFVLVIADNGHGFDWSQVQARSAATVDGIRLATGNGVLNMQKRLEEVGGRCQWDTAPGEGTRVKLRILVKL